MHRETGLRTFADVLIGESRAPRRSSLVKLHDSIDWERIGGILSGVHASKEGRKAYPPLLMMKALLLGHLHRLSDPMLEEEIADRASWQRFLGLSAADDVPDHSTISRFRKRLVEDGLMRKVFDAVNEQLDEKGLILREGTVIDASVVEAHARQRGPGNRPNRVDPDAGWAVKGRRGVFGYKGHFAIDLGSLLVRDVEVTPASEPDTVLFDRMVQGDEGGVYADRAYDKRSRHDDLARRGVADGLMRRGNKHHRLPARDELRNLEISRLRMPAEGVFGYLKQALGWRRARYDGLARNEFEALIKCTVWNLTRARNMLERRAASQT